MGSHPRHYCLDTGPLLDFLLVRFERSGQRLGRAAAKVLFLNYEPLITDFSTLLASSRHLLTVPGVLVEIDRHIQAAGVDADWLHEFRRFCRNELASLNVEECASPYFDLDEELYEKFGPTDASIALLAATRADVTIVSGDQRFGSACLSRQIPFKNVYEVAAELGEQE